MDEVIILAKGETKRDCPHDVEVWGVKDVGIQEECLGKRMDKIFDFEVRKPGYMHKFGDSPPPIVSWQDYADIKYPLEEIKEKFNSEYFTNTVCYQIAYAMYLGIKKIRMYGVDAPFGYPYFLEKAGIEYWIGKAEQYGVEVEICEGSHLLRTKDGQIYGSKVGGTILLYMSERLSLLNLLPKMGRWQDVYISNLTRATLAITTDEGETYGVEIAQNVNGDVTYKSKQEFTKSIWFPDWAWYYLRDMLTRYESMGKLPVTALSVYDKIAKYGRADEEDKRDVRVSFILTTKDRPQFLTHTLDNAEKLLGEDDELIIVDGNSTEETRGIISQHSKLVTKVIIGSDISAAHAFNKGVLSAKGKYLMQHPDDDILFPEGVADAMEFMEDNPDIDLLVCGGTKRGRDGDFRTWAPPNYGQHPSDVFTYGACGTGFFYRRSVFPRVGLLDANHRVPDQEFALRVMSLGQVRFLPTKMYLHPIYEHSTSVQNIEEAKEQHRQLVRRYCSRSYLWRQRLFVKLARVQKWLGHIPILSSRK